MPRSIGVRQIALLEQYRSTRVPQGSTRALSFFKAYAYLS